MHYGKVNDSRKATEVTHHLYYADFETAKVDAKLLGLKVKPVDGGWEVDGKLIVAVVEGDEDHIYNIATDESGDWTLDNDDDEVTWR